MGNPVVTAPGGDPGFGVDDVVLVANCEQAAMFRVTGMNVAGNDWSTRARARPTGRWAALLAVVGGLGLAGTMSLNVLERTREIGVMRAVGGSDGSVRLIVVFEGLFVGILSWVLSAPL